MEGLISKTWLYYEVHTTIIFYVDLSPAYVGSHTYIEVPFYYM
jgi:hypothetical protein